MNDILLSLLALDVITDNDGEKGGENKGFSRFVGFCLAVLGIIAVFAILSKLGISDEQLLMAVMVILAPFLWDYFVNFAVMDLTNNQHILAAGATIVVAFIILLVLEVISKGAERCSNSNYTFIQSIGLLVHMSASPLKGIVQAVLVFSLFKGAIHAMVAFLLWLF